MRVCEMNKITYKERAQFYDVEYIDKRDWNMLKAYIINSNNILEIPSGSGRNVGLYEDLKSEQKVTLIDKETQMVNIVKEKIVNNKNMLCLEGDMLDFSLSNQFDLILVPQEAFQLLIEKDEAQKVLLNFKRHLAVNGVIIIDIYRFGVLEKNNKNKPNYYDYNFSGKLKKDWSRKYNGQVLTRWSKQCFDNDKGILSIEFIYKHVINNQEIKRYSSCLNIKNYDMESFVSICGSCGLKIYEVYGDYQFKKYVSEDNRMIFILRGEQP